MIKALLAITLFFTVSLQAAGTPTPTASRTVTLVVTPSRTATPTASMTTVQSSTFTPTSTLSPTVTPSPSMTRTPFVSQVFTNAGKVAWIPLQINLTNTSGVTLTAMSYWMSWPSYLSLNPNSYSSTISQTGNVLNLNVPLLAPGASIHQSITVNVPLGPVSFGCQQSTKSGAEDRDRDIAHDLTPNWNQTTLH